MIWLKELALTGQMAFIALAIVGWGGLLALVLGRVLRTDAATDGGSVVLYGFYLTLLFSQVAPLFAPLGGVIGTAWGATGVALLAIRFRALLSAFGGPTTAIALFVLTAGAALVPAAAIQPRYDAALYHFQFVQWIAEHGTVLGVANVHGRLGFNSAWLTASALFSSPAEIANGAVTWHVIGVVLLYAALLFSGIAALRRGQRLSGAFAVISATILVALPIDNDVTNATSTDLPTALVMLHGFAAALAWSESRNAGNYAVLACCVAMAIVLKLSSAPIALLLLTGTPYAWRNAAGRRCLLAASALIATLGAAWAVQNIALSGCVVYPILSSCLDLPWTVDAARTASEAHWVTAWARLPSHPPGDPILQNFRWIEPWLANHGYMLRAVAALLAASVAAAVVAVLLRRQAMLIRQFGLPLAVSVVGLVFWFVAAPDPRFAMAFIVAVPALLLAYSALEYRRALTGTCIVMVLYLGYQQLKIWEPFRNRPDRHNLALGLQFRAPQLASRVTRHGVPVSVVVGDDRCWLTALPCTPYFNPNLAERKFGPYLMFTVRE